MQVPVYAIALLLFLASGVCFAQNQALVSDENAQEITMSDAQFLPGLAYNEQLANILGLSLDSQTSIKAPLLGAALDLSLGVTGGHVCQLHVFLQEGTDIRLPAENSMRSVGGSVKHLPFIFLEKPNAELKKEMGRVIGELANRLIVRFGRGDLENDVLASEDKQGSYVSLPLNEYNKQLFPGVMWLSTPINCAIVTETTYDTVTVYFEKSTSPEDMIINQTISPEKLGSVDVPLALFTGMREDIEQALLMDDDGSKGKEIHKRYRIFLD